jgi:hypothetical protein
MRLSASNSAADPIQGHIAAVRFTACDFRPGGAHDLITLSEMAGGESA